MGEILDDTERDPDERKEVYLGRKYAGVAVSYNGVQGRLGELLAGEEIARGGRKAIEAAASDAVRSERIIDLLQSAGVEVAGIDIDMPPLPEGS